MCNLERVVKYFIDDIPDQYKESFVNHIKDKGNVKFDFITTFPLEEFGEKIIRALYVWEPEEDPKVVQNYKYLLKTSFNSLITSSTIRILTLMMRVAPWYVTIIPFRPSPSTRRATMKRPINPATLCLPPPRRMARSFACSM